ncbi:hypothetical protein ACFT7S_16925 [Streptomyces sp. NPDC057136]|uniref:hypothetical protein n=1 Tax=Streptomyces sp. NPDC057136 TaxID=3346029 RepID=UPI0036424CB4
MKRSTGRAVTGVALVGAVLLLTGCGDGADVDTPRSAPSASRGSPGSGNNTSTAPPLPPSAPASTPAASASPAPTVADELLIAVTVSGGIDGRQQRMLINGDGSYSTLSHGEPEGEGRMKPAEMASLRAALAEADFAKLPRINLGEQPIFDGLTTAVVYQGHEVVTDGSKPVPGLDRVIAALPPMNAGS